MKTVNIRNREGALPAASSSRVLGPLLALALTGLACLPAQALDLVLGQADCNEAGFVSALDQVQNAGGGSIAFDCGPSPVTISFSNYRSISDPVVIDGGGMISFDGNHSSAFFQIFFNARLELHGLTLTKGTLSTAYPLENFGELLLDDVTVQDCNNSALENFGDAEIRNSRFVGNRAPASGGGAAINVDSGTVRIVASEFIDNQVNNGNSPGVGGAIRVASTDNQALLIRDSQFSANQAFDGGAIFIASGTTGTRIEDSLFEQNVAGYGGVFRSHGSGVGVYRSKFHDNQATAGDGGALWQLEGSLFVSDSDFEGNQANTTGGAISCYGNSLNIFNSSFATNQSVGSGGALYSTCAMITANSTFHANSATGVGSGGGAIYQDGPPSGFVYYLTMADNSASYGAGIASDGSNDSVVQSYGSVFAGNVGGNCGGVLESFGYNLSDDSHCAGSLTSIGDQHDLALLLEPYGDYGGLTNTRPPQPGNPAIDHIPEADCQSLYPLDQRAATRPFNGACDSGAVELGAVAGRIFFDRFE